MANRRTIKYFSEEDKRKLLSTLNDRKSAERDYMLFNMIFNTGLRVSEASSLTVGHVRDRKTIEITGKGDITRDIPLNKKIREHIEKYLRFKQRKREGLLDSDPLFVSRKGNRLSIRAMQRALDKWTKKADIKTKFHPHALRHTFATEVYGKCKNIRVVQELLGHADVSTTMVYTHVTKDEMQEAVELLD